MKLAKALKVSKVSNFSGKIHTSAKSKNKCMICSVSVSAFTYT